MIARSVSKICLSVIKHVYIDSERRERSLIKSGPTGRIETSHTNEDYDMEYIKDVLFIKTLEKRLGRRLTDEEVNAIEPFQVTFKDGSVELVRIPLLPFPEYFITDYTYDYYRQEENENGDDV